MTPIVDLSAILLYLSAASAAVVPRQDSANATTFDVTSGDKAKVKDAAPVAISIEFFAFPEYVQVLGNTAQCLKNLGDAAGAATRIRIGGTTQDRATYDPSSTAAVTYSVDDPADAPANLTYGPAFFELASHLSGPATIGLNRRLNDISNTIAAAQEAVERMDNLFAIELGNEPDLYTDDDPIANHQTWSPSLDAQIQVDWQRQIATALHRTSIIQAGVFLQPPAFSIAELGPLEQAAGSLGYVRSWADHAYPQSACGGATTDLESLQNHSGIVKFVGTFRGEVDAAEEVGEGRPLVFGETNSATCGGGGISGTYGAGLWIVDYVLQSVKLGYERLYFHHEGTIGNSPYSWWGRDQVFSPYYGAIFAASALNDAAYMTQLDASTSHLAIYTFHASNDTLLRAVILNTQYYPNTTTAASRPSETVVLTGLEDGESGEGKGKVKGKRLTARWSGLEVAYGESPTFGGQRFNGESCEAEGEEVWEEMDVAGGEVTIEVAASEAVLVYF
ncbi:hypothetical protein L198_07972 [Cryptococcus wingfieldii CBS 7118]|uniref:Beta-glucuronidase C-terminal domain-containing protein n=1 Tax=Cryptococcus wingfieldii CBS 7118 TaxID=1295528 RepID=A0A1E3HP95_9TREE|nr:hypothetical protein L198_07972 [Cryptococcus wingfieldii CBS 7118]ODN78183.1 hypothetical protein L198_07972 [Cryptococcus wingfieldii CBS 7118]